MATLHGRPVLPELYQPGNLNSVECIAENEMSTSWAIRGTDKTTAPVPLEQQYSYRSSTTMPMHRIYTTSGLYSPTEKKALATAITKVYQSYGLPAFYVNVFFIDLPKDSFYIGGETNDNFVRFNVQHIARAFPDNKSKLGFMETYEKTLKPFTADKGVDWEVNVDEADPLTWNENGMSPPAPGSEGEKLWISLNKAVPFEGPAFKDRA